MLCFADLPDMANISPLKYSWRSSAARSIFKDSAADSGVIRYGSPMLRLSDLRLRILGFAAYQSRGRDSHLLQERQIQHGQSRLIHGLVFPAADNSP